MAKEKGETKTGITTGGKTVVLPIKAIALFVQTLVKEREKAKGDRDVRDKG